MNSKQKNAMPIQKGMLIGLVLSLLIGQSQAVQPYTPVQPDPVLEEWRWTRFPELNGLGLRCLTEDRAGNMWFGVDDGVVRYDGVTWTVYGQKDGLYGVPVTELLGARDGSVYAGTDLGISRFADGKWQRFFPSKGDLPWPMTSLMEARDGSVWGGTLWGALRLSRDEALLYTTKDIGRGLQRLGIDVKLSVVPNTAALVLPWPKIGMGWGARVVTVVASGGSAERAGIEVGDRIVAVDGKINGSTGTQVRITMQRAGRAFDVSVVLEEVDGARNEFRIADIYEDREGVMWLALANGEIVRFDALGTDDSWRRYTQADGLETSLRSRIFQTRDGVIWTVSEENFRGMNRFDGHTWTNFKLSHVGGNDPNTSMVETRDGTLWIGGGGLHAFRNGAWQSYGNTEGVNGLPIGNRTRLFEASDGALWAAGLGQEAARLDLNTSRWTVYEGLNFECETPDGSAWFVSGDNGVVRFDGKAWMRYGVEDGLMDSPLHLLATRQGDVWAMGSHDSTAATARFNGTNWKHQVHPELSWGILVGIESMDEHLYFSGQMDFLQGQVGGLLRFDGKAWIHLLPPEVPRAAYGIAQTSDGRLWFTGFGLSTFDGQQRTILEEPEELTGLQGSVTTPVVAQKNTVWVGSRSYGAFYYDRQNWIRYDMQSGLLDNQVLDLLITKDGSVWASTFTGISRFDGHTWTTNAFSQDLRGKLCQSLDGAIWINTDSGRSWRRRARPGAAPQESYGLQTVRYQPDRVPPETEITLSVEEVSQPGNTTLAWKGVDPWKATPDEEIQYAYRLDNGDWSAFSHQTNQVLQALSSGRHTFEVISRDRDFNVDPTPAKVMFSVVPPVWQEPWFIAMVVLFAGAVSIQTTRVIRRDRRLHITNDALSSANKDLFKVNIDLQQKTEDLEAANIQIQEQTERKSAFLASMSHELRTPMNAIKGFTSLVLRRAGDILPDRQRENLQKVNQASDHLMALINDLLDLSKIEAGRMDVNPTQFRVQNLITYCVSTVSPLVKDGVKLSYEISDDVGEAHTDEARLRQMVINLLSNAIKFTDVGEVRVTAKTDDGQWTMDDGKGEGEVSGKRQAASGKGEGDDGSQMLVIEVSDTGKGIPAEELSTIFDEYRQVKGSESSVQKGTGLGLSITKKFAELLGGTISVESEVGKGSTFRVQIPAVYKTQRRCCTKEIVEREGAPK